jgi:hypothetical protein
VRRAHPRWLSASSGRSCPGPFGSVVLEFLGWRPCGLCLGAPRTEDSDLDLHGDHAAEVPYGGENSNGIERCAREGSRQAAPRGSHSVRDATMERARSA